MILIRTEVPVPQVLQSLTVTEAPRRSARTMERIAALL
jgi:hypothetical protein